MIGKSWITTLAWRHLSGKGSRSAVKWMNIFAFLGLSLSVFAWISVTSIMGGMQNQIRDKILSEKPHLLWEGRPRENAAESLQKIYEILGDEVQDAFTYLRSEALVDLEQERRSVQRAAVLEGRDDVESGQAILGFEIYSELAARENDLLKLRSVWALEKFPLDLRVAGLFESGLYEIDKSLIRVSRFDLSSWLELGDDAFSFLSLKLRDPNRAEILKNRLQVAQYPLSLKTWQEADSALWYSLRLEKIVMSLAVFFVVILSTFALYMAMSVRLAEKSRELALLRGLGAKRKELQKLFLIEGAALASVAAVVGVFFSWLFCQLLVRGVHLPDFYYSTAIPVDWSWLRALILALVVLFLGLLSTWWPVRRGFDFSVAETLRS
jgi:lipoprotein-releasing system permease protein